MQSTVYFIRHAKSPFSLENYHKRNLSLEGAEAATIVAGVLQNEPIEFFISSSSPRAVETIQPLANLKNKPIEQHDELEELVLRGPNIHLEPDEVEQEIKKVFELPDYKLPGGQSRKEVEKRGVSKFKEIFNTYKGKNFALGTHGLIMTFILASFDPYFNFEFWKNTSKPDIYRVIFSNEKIIKTDRLWN